MIAAACGSTVHSLSACCEGLSLKAFLNAAAALLLLAADWQRLAAAPAAANAADAAGWVLQQLQHQLQQKLQQQLQQQQKQQVQLQQQQAAKLSFSSREILMNAAVAV